MDDVYLKPPEQPRSQDLFPGSAVEELNTGCREQIHSNSLSAFNWFKERSEYSKTLVSPAIYFNPGISFCYHLFSGVEALLREKVIAVRKSSIVIRLAGC